MRFRDKPELHERLAAEYALGTLRGAPRRRLERWMREDGALALAVARWEARLAPLSAAVAPVAPPARVWRAVRERLAPAGARLWSSAPFWRALGLTVSGMAAALLVALVLLAPQPPQPAPAPVALRAPHHEMSATYVAVLSDPKTQQPVVVVSASRKAADLWVKTLDPSIAVAGKSLELWGLPQGKAPRPLGLIPPGGKMASIKLAAAADQALADVATLAVSLEPEGGSPTGAPTGPVLVSGPCVKYW
jgi:anti-sigma-K factor RskA